MEIRRKPFVATNKRPMDHEYKYHEGNDSVKARIYTEKIPARNLSLFFQLNMSCDNGTSVTIIFLD